MINHQLIPPNTPVNQLTLKGLEDVCTGAADQEFSDDPDIAATEQQVYSAWKYRRDSLVVTSDAVIERYWDWILSGFDLGSPTFWQRPQQEIEQEITKWREKKIKPLWQFYQNIEQFLL